MQTKHLNAVGPGERVKIDGSMGRIIIDGDVGERAHVFINGSMGLIQIGGYIHAGARVYIRGSMGKIYHDGAHETASVEVDGSMGQVLGPGVKKPKPPADKSGLGFSGGFFSTSEDRVVVSGFKGNSLKIANGEIWVDGEKVEPEEAEDHNEVTIQKSARPREQWGT